MTLMMLGSFRDVIADKSDELWDLNGAYFQGLDGTVNTAAKLKAKMLDANSQINETLLGFII